MKVIFDIDGTLSDFNMYVEKYALPYFKKKYSMEIVYPDALEIEDILDLENVLQKKYQCTDLEALRKKEKFINHYWIGLRYLHFCLLYRFRHGCAKTVRDLKRLGIEVEIYSSRAHATDKDIVGKVASGMARIQLWINGIWLYPSRVHFFKNDKEKIGALIEDAPQIVFEDKVEVIEKLTAAHIPVVCIAGKHNKKITTMQGIERIENYKEIVVPELLDKLVGTKKMKYYTKAISSGKLWKRIVMIEPLIRAYFRPIILHKENCIRTSEAIVYAPNHRSTLDPILISAVVKKEIHWAALLRFFQGKDSIFNNSKNYLLCKITAGFFKKAEYFPIERISDNPKANNWEAIRDMVGFLQIGQKVGIFGEGTTRRCDGKEFGIFDDSIIVLAKKTGAWLAPITIYWETVKKRKRVILNFGEPFKVLELKKEEAMEKFLSIQKKCLQECKDVIEQCR